jgi:hypothetical protein
MASNGLDAWTEVRKIQKEFSGFYKIAGGLLLVCIGIGIGSVLFRNETGYWGNILSEALGIGFAVFVLDQRAEQRRVKDLQQRLVMEAGSSSNDTAKRALDELRHRGWLCETEGLLRGARLRAAHLQETDLRLANLREAALTDCHLQGANLGDADLRDADLRDAHLHGANLWSADLRSTVLMRAHLQESAFEFADLRGALLEFADLEGASLVKAKLQGANLWEANLKDARLDGAVFDEHTLLPDRSTWSPDTDMKRFTDAEHPQFWRSGERWSPAYQGKSERSA